MKLPWVIVVAIVSGFIGFAAEKLHISIKNTQSLSEAGQTLVDLSRTLEEVKRARGSFPESIKDLKVASQSPEFSEKVLKRVFYLKTSNGFIAFSGLPSVAYIYPGVSTQFQ